MVTAAHYEALAEAMGGRVVQVWRSKDELDAFNQAHLFPAFARLGDRGFPVPPEVVDFETSHLD